MAYKQEPGRGPMAVFKNVAPLLGPTANGVDPTTGVKNLERPATTRSETLSIGRKDLENTNKKAFNQTDIGKPLSDNITKLSQTINSKNKKLRDKSRKEYETAVNLYRTSFAEYEKKVNDNRPAFDKADIVMQKKTKVDKARQKAGKVDKFDPKKASNFVG